MDTQSASRTFLLLLQITQIVIKKLSMKKFMSASILATLFTFINAQEVVKDTIWKTGGVVSLNVTQAYFENWTAGGVPSITGVGFIKLFATYEKSKWRWDNQLDMAYGLIQERQSNQRKTDDKLNFDTKLGYNVGNKWYASLLGSFRTQFTPAYEDPDIQVVKISDFMSPAYLTISLGIDHIPNDNFSFFFSPISSKITMVTDQELADKGAFGVEKAKWDTTVVDSITIDSTLIEEGLNVRYEFGAHIKIMYKAKVWDNVDFITKLELYANYLENFGNVDVNWEGLLDMKINQYLSANLRVEVIYDDDIDIPTGTNEAGNQTFGPRMQLKQMFGLGISYKF